jgi:putative DNA primase/helicase
VPNALRYHQHLYYRHDDGRYTYHPAMIAAVQDPHGTVISLHRTYLTDAGSKASVPSPKKSMPTPTTMRGAAVRLDPPGETLAVTEGIETALAVRLSAGVPVWAAISATGMKSLVVPDVVHLVVICADHDANGIGEQAARLLAQRLLAEQRRVKILMPRELGADWADGLERERHG